MKLLFAFGLCALPASASFPNGYSYCKIVTTSHAMVSGISDLVNYPLTVSLTDPDLKTTGNGGLVNNASGHDIGFGPDCSGSGALLKWELESYAPATGSIIAHVLRPTLSHTSDDSIGMYYGGAFTAFQSTASAVWDTYYKGVWHLESLAVNDSTGNDNGTNNGGTLTTGKIGSAVAFSGNTYIDLNNPVNLAPPFTLEVWINITAPKTFARVLGNLTSTNYSGYELYLGVNGDTKANFQIGNAGNLGLTRSSVDLGTGWHHLAATLTGTTMTLYVDGVAPTQTQSPTGSGIANSSASLNIGRWSGGASNYFDDPVDEVRLSGGISRSPDWILTEYRNQSSPATYITAGPRISSSSRIRHRVIGGM
ncbi:MAG: LamG domain protein jellyroll fold domain protein [Candidatus Solibacter sp.]|nr:LamG domain protein jellyroll fold domain protein [Candidatus Solibacter sp.]